MLLPFILLLESLLYVYGQNEEFLLPKTITPIEYDITLTPYLDNAPPGKENFTFDGTVRITLVANSTTDKIVLHKNDITIETATITNGNVLYTNYSNDNNHFLTLNLDSDLVPDTTYQLEIKYFGHLNNDMEGFYRSSYVDAQGNTRWLAVTQFAAVGARRAFPCWDEPNWKAKFTLHIAHPPGYIVLSNMPVSEETILDDPILEGWNTTHFEKSMLMSTYIVAFTVNQHESVTSTEDPRLQLWSRPESLNQASLALGTAPEAIRFMTTYTSYLYPLPKMDLFAVPDFVFKAMENWGMVTFRESALLFSEGISTTYDQQRVETVVTHELAHQWFGDLVTPDWWSVAWLSEGFATFFEYHALSRKGWDLKGQFVQREMQFIMQQDATENTHPLLTNINSSYAANAAFDDLIYMKGGSLLRMLENLMGESVFRIGIFDYIRTKQFDNAVMDDLWASLNIQASNFLPPGETMKSVMDTWTLQSGYPVITITRDYVAKVAVVKQNRFMTQNKEGITYDETWLVPLTFTSALDSNFEVSDANIVWHSGPDFLLDLSLMTTSSDQWIICNLQEYGYYRVNYDEENWQLLASSQLNLHYINRAQLMDDALALARAGLLQYSTAIKMTDYLNRETDYMPWAAGLASLRYLYDRLSNETESRNSIQWYLLDKIGPVYTSLGSLLVLEQDTHATRLQRDLIYSWACLCEHQTCRSDAATLYNSWKNVTNPGSPVVPVLAPDLKRVVYCEGMRQGNQDDYDFLFDRYEASANYASEQALILIALGCATDPEILERYLAASITPNSGIRKQDSKSVITAVYNNYWGVDIALDFLLTRYNEILEYYGSFGNIESVFYGISTKLNTKEQRDKLENFMNTTDLGQVRIAVEAAIKTVDETLQWHESYRSTVIGIFNNLKNSATPIMVSNLFLILTVILALYL